MNFKTIVGPKDWLEFTRSLLLLLIIVGGGVVVAGNFQWVQISDYQISEQAILTKIRVASAEQTEALKAVTRAQQDAAQDVKLQLVMQRISALDADITFLEIKISQDEATKSEKILLPTLKLKMRQLKSEID